MKHPTSRASDHGVSPTMRPALGQTLNMTTPIETAPSNGSVTLADVARHVGVSARTVSRVVNDEGGCTPRTRDRIIAAIDELGYQPNLMARGLIRRRSDTIGLVTADFLDPFFPEIAEGVQRAAHRMNRTMFLACTNNDRQRQRAALRSLHGHGVDGVIVFPAMNSRDDLVGLAAGGLPIVVVNDEITAPGIASVTADIQFGAELAVEHLLERSRSRIAMLIVHKSHPGEQGRREIGYRRALRRAGVPEQEELLVEVDNSIEGGRHGARSLLCLTRRPDAIFAYNDMIALGVLHELIASGITVPDEIALVGFNDIALCQAVTPQLTSIRIDRDLLGQTAVETLHTLLNDRDGNNEPRRLPVELKPRGSSQTPTPGG